MILVTGATGNSGSMIIDALSSAGAKCRALVRTPAKARQLANVQNVAGDLMDPKSLDAAFSGVDKLMLISPPSSQGGQMEANALAAAKRAGLKHIVKFSADCGTLDSTVRFAKMHHASENDIKSSGISWTFLRPTFFMQNFLGMAGTIKAGAIYSDAGDGKAAHIDLADVAAVAVRALTAPGHEGKIYQLSGPAAYSYDEVASIFARQLARLVSCVKISHQDMLNTLVKLGVPQWQAEGVTELSEATAQGRTATVTDTVQKVTGKPPKTLEQWIRENLPAFK